MVSGHDVLMGPPSHGGWLVMCYETLIIWWLASDVLGTIFTWLLACNVLRDPHHMVASQ